MVTGRRTLRGRDGGVGGPPDLGQTHRCACGADVYFLLFQIEVIFPEDSMQNERQFVWTSEQAGADTFDLRRAGTACDREFDIDITVWCRSVSTPLRVPHRVPDFLDCRPGAQKCYMSPREYAASLSVSHARAKKGVAPALACSSMLEPLQTACHCF
jgi:hypothetical protein